MIGTVKRTVKGRFHGSKKAVSHTFQRSSTLTWEERGNMGFALKKKGGEIYLTLARKKQKSCMVIKFLFV